MGLRDKLVLFSSKNREVLGVRRFAAFFSRLVLPSSVSFSPRAFRFRVLLFSRELLVIQSLTKTLIASYGVAV